MIIKTDFFDVDEAMVNVVAILNDKLLHDDFKNVIIWIKDGKIRFVVNSGNVISLTDLAGEVDFEDESGVAGEVFVQLKARDVNDVLGTFKGLKRTKVNGVEFHIKENEAVMQIIEAPIDETMDNADFYNQVSKFRVTKVPLKDNIKNEILKINLDVRGIELVKADVLLYLNALLPTVAKEIREGTSHVFLGEDYYYTMLQAYIAIMHNKLPQEFSGFKLPNTVCNFLKNFVSVDDVCIMHKEDAGNGKIILTLKNSVSVAVIKCADMARAYDITNFLSFPDNGIVLDRMYLMDVLKRMQLTSEAIFVEIDIANGVGMMKVVSKNMTQNIPVIRAKGEGNYTFSIRAELFSNVVFNHASYFDDSIYLYFEKGDRGNIVMVCSDNTQLWHTKMMGLTEARGKFAWG